MAMVYLRIKKKMRYMKVNMLMIKKKVKVHTYGLMGINISESLKMIKEMDKVKCF